MRKFLSVLILCAGLTALIIPIRAETTLWHSAYLSGFPDGTIRPESPLTRAQLAAVLSRFLTEEARADLTGRDTCFRDVPPDHWAYAPVTVASELGLLTGNSEGCFCPDDPVSRTDLALVLNLLVHTESASAALPELSACWQSADVSFSGGHGWVMGFDGQTFRPESPLTRAEFAQIWNLVLHRCPASLDDLLVGMPLWPDNSDAAAWYFLHIQEAATDHTAAQTGAGEQWLALG